MVRFAIICVIIGTIMANYIIPFIYAVKCDSFKRAVFFNWGVLIIWGFFMFLTPVILYGINETTAAIAKEAFPELLAWPMFGAIFFGWLWAIIITGIAQGGRKLYKKSNPETSHE